jgi:Abortive infection alpha
MSDAESPEQDGLGAVPGLVRLAASAWWHTTEWTIGTTLRGGRRLLRAVTSPESAVDFAQEVQAAARRVAGERGAEPVDIEQPAKADASGNGPRAASPLRDQGEELLRRSRDVRFHEEAHPAYERILSELAPDEGRILLLLVTSGPQPAVDIRTGGPLGLLRSRLIAPGLSMIGARAGARYSDRVPSYLHNLFRLGLIWFSRETLLDPLRYQVLEAQPDVLAAIHSVRQAKVVRRSIHLTPFGEDFCRACLPLASEQVPVHGTPDDEVGVAPPPVP